MTYARRMWPAFETYHAHIYFVPEAAEAYRALGLKGGWMGYFASRSAALGPASPGLVTAVFFNFHPAMVARALPDAWALASPDDVLDARLRTADVALRRLIPDHVGSPEEAEAAALAREAAEAPALAGRPLYGALTDAGRAERAEVEARTDALAEEPWRALGPERTERLLALLAPMARAINEAGGVPVPNPVGVPAP